MRHVLPSSLFQWILPQDRTPPDFEITSQSYLVILVIIIMFWFWFLNQLVTHPLAWHDFSLDGTTKIIKNLLPDLRTSRSLASRPLTFESDDRISEKSGYCCPFLMFTKPTSHIIASKLFFLYIMFPSLFITLLVKVENNPGNHAIFWNGKVADTNLIRLDINNLIRGRVLIFIGCLLPTCHSPGGQFCELNNKPSYFEPLTAWKRRHAQVPLSEQFCYRAPSCYFVT